MSHNCFSPLLAVKADEDEDEPKVDDSLGKSREGSRTDDEVVQR